jgi:uncharacterized membrane protein
VSDEAAHFRKAASKEVIYFRGELEISESAQSFSDIKIFSWDFIGENKGYKYRVAEIISFKDKFLWDDKFVKANLFAVTGYPYTSYIFSKIGIGISKMFTDKIFYSFYFGRLSNFFFALLALTITLKYLNKGRELLFILLCMPMTLSLLASFNQDCVLISFSCLLILLLNQFNNLRSPFLLLIIINFILMFLILARPPFIPLLLIPFVLLKKENKKFNYFLFISFIFFLILSLFFILTFPTPSSPINLEYFLSNPTNFLKVIVLDLYFHTFTYVLQFIGYLGHINISLPIPVYLFFAFSIFFISLLTLYNGKKTLIKYFDFFIIITAIIGACILIFMSQYLYFTDITNRDTFIQGVAGRYFIPLAIILTSMLPKIKKDFYLVKIIIVIVPHINIIAINKIYNFFY